MKTKYILPVLIVLVAFVGVAPTSGATITSTATGGNWNTGGTWVGGSAPGAGDDVVIATTGASAVTLNVSATVASLTVNSGSILTVGSSTTVRILTVSGSVVNNGTIAPNSSGTTTAHGLLIGGDFSNNGTFTVVNSAVVINVTLNGTGAQSIGGTVATVFNNLTNANTAAAVTASASFSIRSGATMTVNGNATFNAGANVISGAGTFTLANNSTLGIGSADGITTAGTASGNIQTTTRNFVVLARYTYNGGANQNTGTGLPNNLTGILTINNPGNTVTLSSARTIANGGTVNIVDGTFAAGTSLTLASTSSITRSGGSMTGTPQGAGIYNVTYSGSSMTTATELAGSGLNNVTVNLTGGQTLSLDQNRVPDGNLSISNGLLDLGSFTIS